MRQPAELTQLPTERVRRSADADDTCQQDAIACDQDSNLGSLRNRICQIDCQDNQRGAHVLYDTAQSQQQFRPAVEGIGLASS